jgi:hypothetical protein
VFAGLSIGFVGYWLAYFGYCSLRGAGVGLLDLVIPGRDVRIPGSLGAPLEPPAPGTFSTPNPNLQPRGNTKVPATLNPDGTVTYG